jgi:hypothetical protein
MIPHKNNWRKRRTNKTWTLLQTTGGQDDRCLYEGSCLVCSSFPPVVCRRDHVLFVRLFLQLFVGGIMSCLFVFSSSGL